MISTASTTSVALMTSTASFHQKNLYFKRKMYIIDGYYFFITWKRSLKVILNQFTLPFQSDLLIIRWMARNIKKLKKNWWFGHKHVGFKILAKIKIYILTRAELLFTLCYEIPCICLYALVSQATALRPFHL